MSDKKDWQEQLAEVYKVVSDRQKNIKREPSKFDDVVGRKGMKGFSDSGIPLTDKAAKQQQRNKASYNSRRGQYHFSRLRVINDARAEASRKYRMTNPEHAALVEKIANKTYEELQKQKEEVVEKIKKEEQRPVYRPLDDEDFNRPITRRTFNYYDPIKVDDTIEVIPARDNVSEPRFKNKIDEAIYRLKNKKY